ncbi:helix-turn-helix transcriptional regulator [Goodfellowiella coeruleoviolacea]
MAGLTSYLGGRSDVGVLLTQQVADADVCVVAADRVSREVMSTLRAVAEEGTGPTVLVTGQLDPADLLTVVECRVVAVLPRGAATDDRLIGGIRAAATGGGVLPPELLGELLRQVERLQRQVLAPRGLNASGLMPREINVLRLMAEGLDTTEIADRLCYSERTVRNIIYTMSSRLNLRNRPHAVAYAMRAGMI